jgi:iron complex transport system ATP-binding protein
MTLKVDTVEFSYKNQRVLSHIDFSVEQGQIMCVLGVNGAGKSTLLKCLNCILKPQKGSILIEQKDIFAMSQNSIAKQIGYVPQRHPETRLTVFESVLLGRRPHIRWSVGKEDYTLVEEIITKMGIGHLSMRPMTTLSGGEVQKVLIARALAQSPGILLLDEPTSNLDLKNQLDVMTLVQETVRSRKLAAVIAIHDLNTALRFADRFLFLKDKKIYGISGKEELNSTMIKDVYGVEVSLTQFKGHTIVVPT